MWSCNTGLDRLLQFSLQITASGSEQFIFILYFIAYYPVKTCRDWIIFIFNSSESEVKRWKMQERAEERFEKLRNETRITESIKGQISNRYREITEE